MFSFHNSGQSEFIYHIYTYIFEYNMKRFIIAGTFFFLGGGGGGEFEVMGIFHNYLIE